MDELREAARLLVAEARSIEAALDEDDEVPSTERLASLQHAVERIQRGLNRMQTAMDSWTEKTEGA